MLKKAAAITTMLLPALLFTGCPGEETKEARVEISGPVSVTVGQTIKLNASTVNDTDSGYTWTSANDAIATVDGTGTVTGVAAGETTITAKGSDTGKSATHGVVVLSEGGGGQAVVVVTVPNYQLAVGDTVQASATTVNAEDGSYTWSSSDEAVATVDSSGLITAVAAGEAVITATGDQSSASGDVGVVVSGEGGGVNPQDIPNYEAWSNSGHADSTAEAFNHWNGEGEIPTSCAKCHSTPGYVDYLGGDGTAAGTVDNPAPIGTVITCQACHDAAAQKLDTVTFPSGAALTNLGSQARCQVCHQGRESTVSVNDAVAGAADRDTPIDGQGFINVHYFAAGATLNGGLVQGGYQYDGQSYDARFQHVYQQGLDTCNGCHSPHSLAIQTDTCATCHDGVDSAEATHDIRMIDSKAADYDGDGNTDEGIFYEVQGLHELLLAAMQTYATDTLGSAICYDGATYPYFFVDTNSDGTCSADEAAFANAYASWSPKILEAAYNYQFVQKDPGAFAHNAKYVIQLMYDGIADLGGDVSGLTRNDPGHFAGSNEPFRHWDAEPFPAGDPADPAMVEASCSKCHSGAEGLHFYLEYGAHNEVPVADVNGFQCTTCHTDEATYMGASTAPVLDVTSFTFEQNDVTITDYAQGSNTASNICATCHQGRESKSTVDAAIAAEDLGFLNIHYLASAATLMGNDATIGYEYDGQTYVGRFMHRGSDSNACTFCHEPAASNHSFQPQLATCTICHSVTDIADIREGTPDYNGVDGTSDTLAAELSTFADRLFAAIQAYASGTAGTAICYDGASYPYFFTDTNDDGTCSADEAVFPNAYSAWDPALMRATFNYQFYQKEPGAWAHNFPYMAELLYDSTDALGGDVTGLTRPPAQ